MWTRLQSASCAVSKSGVSGNGFADYTYYTHTADFFDPGGTTTSMPINNTPWLSGPGYDDVTGLGVPDVTTFMTDVDKATVPCATAPTDQKAFPPTTSMSLGTAAAALPDSHLPVTLLAFGVLAGGAVLGRRRRQPAR